jgi:uracil-DNA glycosylase family 4
MSITYHTLVQAIRRCTACSFRDPAIEPLAPNLPQLPVPGKLLTASDGASAGKALADPQRPATDSRSFPVMFVGENPSWAHEQPAPFAETTISGQALEQHYLQPLGLSRDQVWITDLFKCRYPPAIYADKARYRETIQSVVNTCAGLWLPQEIALARPQVLVTLSDQEVYQRLRRAFRLPTPATFAHAVGWPYAITLGGFSVTLFPMVHPDVSRPWGEGDSRKQAAREKWAPLHREVHIPALRELLG